MVRHRRLEALELVPAGQVVAEAAQRGLVAVAQAEVGDADEGPEHLAGEELVVDTRHGRAGGAVPRGQHGAAPVDLAAQEPAELLDHLVVLMRTRRRPPLEQRPGEERAGARPRAAVELGEGEAAAGGDEVLERPGPPAGRGPLRRRVAACGGLLQRELHAGVADHAVPAEIASVLGAEVGVAAVVVLPVGQPPHTGRDRGAGVGLADGRAALRWSDAHPYTDEHEQRGGDAQPQEPPHRAEPTIRLVRRRVLLLLPVAVLLWPAVDPTPSDGFPVSTYPMFARRSGPVVRLATVVGLDADGHVHRLDPHTIGGGDEVVLASEQVRLAVAEGAASVAALCGEVAARVEDPFIERVEVRTEVRDAVADVRARRPPLDVEVHARCPVGQGP